MSDIAEFITSDKKNLKFSKHNGRSYFKVEGFSLNKLQNFKNYIDKYPLLTKKYNDYKDWCIVYDLILKGEHLTLEGKEKIKKIKSKMNSKRIDIDWSHLNNIK